MTAPETIADGLVAIIHFTLKNDAGEVLDTSEDDDPMPYLHGAENIVPGLEAALTGRRVGDTFSVTVAPEEAYGPRSGAKDQAVPREEFPDDMEVEPEMQFFTEGDGGLIPVWVTRVTDDTVYITLDHPLAGETLHFDISVVGIREATADEKDHGHPHGLDGDEDHHH